MSQFGPRSTPVAVIGMACRLPGADGLDDYWRLVREGSDALVELPPDRLDRELYYHPSKGVPGKSYSQLGGVVAARRLDRAVCPAPEGLEDEHDVAHVLLLEVAAAALRDAGLDPRAVPLPNTGVWVGHARTGPRPGEVVYAAHIEELVGCLSGVPAFERLPEEVRAAVRKELVGRTRREKAHRREDGRPFLGPGMAAGLIAQTFGLTGPHMVIDAACASSLIALALAAYALWQGRVDMALVGGASFSNWQSLALFSRAQALSAAGSFPFEARADGFISSDGYAAVVLKTLDRARADGDRIRAVIRGIGLSADGRGKSLWAPRKEGQVEAIRRAYAGGLDASRIQYLEAHGTSTQLGDATEVESLAAVLGPALAGGPPVPLASVKANIGHTCETAGLAGLIKTVLAMEHGVIPPAANFRTPNPHIAWDKLPFYVPTEAAPWPEPADGHPRRAGVEAFGIGGLNCHLVVDQSAPGEPGGAPSPEGDEGLVAIVGAGAVFPGAPTAAAFWELLASGRDPKSDVPKARWDADLYCAPGATGPWRSPTRRGGFVTGFQHDWHKFRIPPKQLENADPLQFMLLDAADQALSDAGYSGKRFDRRRTGVVVGTMFSGDFVRQLTVALHLPEFERELERLLGEHRVAGEAARKIVDGARRAVLQAKPMLRDETGSYSASTLASRVARTLDLMGGAFAVDAEEASSFAALECAADLLVSGACDLVLCAGAQRSMDISVYEELSLRGLLSEDGDGFLPAEGAGVVLLKRLADARRDGDRIRAVIRGIEARREDGARVSVDAVARQIGHALGAAGVASLLGAIGPHAPANGSLEAVSSRGLRYRLQLERRADEGPPRIAFLFSGQGSQYPGMLRELVRESPAAAAKMQEIDATLAGLGYPTFAELAWSEDAGLGTDVWRTQLSVLVADTLMFAALSATGIRPDVVAGHSFGEYAALAAAGVWTLEQAIRVTRARGELVAASRGRQGVLMATTAPPDVVERLRSVAGGEVYVALHNAPDQTVVGGERGAVARLETLLAAEGFENQLLPVPGPFHTPLLGDVAEPLRVVLARERLLPPRIPVLSSVTNRYVADPPEVRENLAAQLASPLRYVDLVRRLASDGVSVFIEAGPRQVLTRLARRILAGSDAAVIAGDDPQRPGVRQLDQVRSLLRSRGLEAAGPAENEPERSPSRHEVLYFDATLRRRERNRAEPAAAPPSPAAAPAEAAADDWEPFLIHFVCEQTGYPPEVVDLDADLEADLGVDSIKKAQLFGELHERFEFQNAGQLTLQDFTTLRHVLDFLRRHARPKEAGARPASGPGLLHLSGSPYQMGLAHGRARAAEIRAIIERYSRLVGGEVENRPDLRAAMERVETYFGRAGVEELRGLAEGAGLPLYAVAGYNLALVPAFIRACSHFAVTAQANGGEGLIHAANEDAPLLLKLNQPVAPVVAVRRPEGGIPHLTFGLPGQLAGINGINARGVAVSSASLLDHPAPDPAAPGRTHPALVKEILESAGDIDSALAVVRAAGRLGAWGLLLSHHPTGRLCYLEYDGASLEVREPVPRLAGANHSLVLPPPLEMPAHSRHRLARLESLVAANGSGGCTLAQAQTALRDRYDLARGREVRHPTMNTVRRVDNLLSVVMRPARGEVWVAATARGDAYERLDLRELFETRVMRRWVLRAVESPLAASGAPAFHGPALILGENRAAEALRERLSSLGVTVFSLPRSAEAVAAVERLWASAPAPHLFLMTGRDEQASDVLLPYLVCQRWMRLVAEANLTSVATLAAAASLGGDFGFSGRVGSPLGGGLAGLLKAIRREFPGLNTHLVDAPPEEPPERLAAAICTELAAAAPQLETGYLLGRRQVIRALPRPARVRTPVRITRGGAWVVTGGARGVTAFVARELARRFDLDLHVLDKSPAATVELGAFTGAGVRVTCHACDVSDREALRETLETIRRRGHPLRGILHGAGVESAARFDRKQPEAVRATIGAKADSAMHLMELTRPDPLEAFIGFGSISGRFGGHGQTDYSLASEMLAKLIQRFRVERPECASLVFHWPAWDEIGMAARPESRVALEMAGQRFMPPHEGFEHLVAELEAGAPEGEVLIIDAPGVLDLDGTMCAGAVVPVATPLVDGLLAFEPERKAVAEARFDPVADPFLAQHRFRGAPLLPAAVALEALAEAASLVAEGQPMAALRQVEICQGLRFSSPRPQWARLEAERAGDGAACRLVAEFRSRDGKLIDPRRIIVQGQVEFGATGPAPAALGPLPAQWCAMEYPEDGPVWHGADLRCLRQVALDETGAAGRIVAPSPASLGGARGASWLVPSAVLDACLVACGVFAVKVLGGLALPHGFDWLRLYRAPREGEQLTVRAWFRGRQERSVRFDFVLYGEDAAPVLAAEGYSAMLAAGEGGDD